MEEARDRVFCLVTYTATAFTLVSIVAMSVTIPMANNYMSFMKTNIERDLEDCQVSLQSSHLENPYGTNCEGKIFQRSIEEIRQLTPSSSKNEALPHWVDSETGVLRNATIGKREKRQASVCSGLFQRDMGFLEYLHPNGAVSGCCLPGEPGNAGKAGKNGRPGRPGADGAQGFPGRPPRVRFWKYRLRATELTL